MRQVRDGELSYQAGQKRSYRPGSALVLLCTYHCSLDVSSTSPDIYPSVPSGFWLSSQCREIINNNMQYRRFLRRDRHYGWSDGNQSTAGKGGGRYDAVMNIEWKRKGTDREDMVDGENRGSWGGKERGGMGRRGKHWRQRWESRNRGTKGKEKGEKWVWKKVMEMEE